MKKIVILTIFCIIFSSNIFPQDYKFRDTNVLIGELIQYLKFDQKDIMKYFKNVSINISDNGKGRFLNIPRIYYEKYLLADALGWALDGDLGFDYKISFLMNNEILNPKPTMVSLYFEEEGAERNIVNGILRKLGDPLTFSGKPWYFTGNNIPLPGNELVWFYEYFGEIYFVQYNINLQYCVLTVFARVPNTE
jgi:hypothetical protein